MTTPGWRTDFLTQMGFAVADGVGAFARERDSRNVDKSASRSADVLIWTTESDAEQDRLLADPTVATLRATTQRLHRQGTGRRDRVRLAAVVSAGRRPVATAHRPALA